MAIDLDELERQAKEATPGPWVIRHGDGWYNKHSYEIEASDESHVAETLYAYNGEADAAYIVAACNSLPTLIAENRALRERVRGLEEQNKELSGWNYEFQREVRKLQFQLEQAAKEAVE